MILIWLVVVLPQCVTLTNPEPNHFFIAETAFSSNFNAFLRTNALFWHGWDLKKLRTLEPQIKLLVLIRKKVCILFSGLPVFHLKGYFNIYLSLKLFTFFNNMKGIFLILRRNDLVSRSINWNCVMFHWQALGN